MESHDFSTLKPADNDLLVTDEVVDIVRKLLVDNSEMHCVRFKFV